MISDFGLRFPRLVSIFPVFYNEHRFFLYRPLPLAFGAMMLVFKLSLSVQEDVYRASSSGTCTIDQHASI